MNVPYLDLSVQYETIKDEILIAVNEVIEKSAFAGGPFVEKFEHAFARFCGSRHAIGVGSGTEALWLSLLALGIGSDDEVITVPNTFIATVEAISFCGATPVFVDVDPDTFNMDVKALENSITSKTKAIIPVHLYGQMADMGPIMDLARQYGLHVIEDACQAHGAEYHGQRAGTIGDVGCFSFYPGKNLGAFGDAGAVVTDRDDVGQAVRTLRDHGQSAKYRHQIIGWNSRMDGIQGAVLEVKLRHLAAWNDARRQHAAYYNHRLDHVAGLKRPAEAFRLGHVYHIYAILTENRDALMAQLEKRGIHSGIHYPVPVHRQPAYRFLKLPQGSFPVAEALSKQQLSLPMFPELTEKQLDHVVTSLEAALMETRSQRTEIYLETAEV
jgi:dTDP-4-amino-4,6-dideoxygalactose transaminase